MGGCKKKNRNKGKRKAKKEKGSTHSCDVCMSPICRASIISGVLGLPLVLIKFSMNCKVKTNKKCQKVSDGIQGVRWS